MPGRASVVPNSLPRKGTDFCFGSPSQYSDKEIAAFAFPDLFLLDRANQNDIRPAWMQYSDVNPTASHKSTPCNIGRHPTSLSVAREMPLPIKKSVAVNPRRPTVKSCALTRVTIPT